VKKNCLLWMIEIVTAAAIVAPLALCGSNWKADEVVRDIDSHLQLFVDDWLIESMKNVRLQLHSPVRREVVLRFDAPWEGPESGYVTVMQNEDRFRMYYRGGGELSREVTCLAESQDGIHWSKPSLGIIEFNGSKENNIIWTGRERAYWESHNFAPFRDQNPAAIPEQRYKAVALGRYPDEKGERRKMLVGFVSPDGIHWKRLREEPIITEGSFDSLNTAFWDTVQKTYVCYSRHVRNGKRSIQRCTSNDFVNWTKPEWLDFGNTPLEHLYTNGIIPYFRAPHLYLAFPMRFVPERKTIGAEARTIDGTSDAVFMSSHDGLHWDRPFMEAFIRPGLDQSNWGDAHGNTTPAWGILSTSEEEISLYWTEHYGNIPHVRRGTLRTDGFVSVNAPFEGGEFLTKPLRFTGTSLAINYSTSAVGSVKVEIQDVEGNPISGFDLNSATEIYGDELERPVTWKQGADVSTLAGKLMRLRFVMKDADLFSIRFQQ
jgi:hypothetical protein